MNGTVTVEYDTTPVGGYWMASPRIGVVHVNTDADGNLWASGHGCGDGLVPATSVEASRGQQMVIVTTTGRTIRPGKVTGIRCSTKTVGEYEATGFWAGPS